MQKSIIMMLSLSLLTVLEITLVDNSTPAIKHILHTNRSVSLHTNVFDEHTRKPTVLK